MWQQLGLFGVGFLVVVACSAGGDGKQVSSGGNSGGGQGASGGKGQGGSSATGGVLTGGSGGDGFGGFGGSTGGTLQDGGECAAQTRRADNTVRPVDIIWALDTSCSMIEEAREVQDNLNLFAGGILSQNIDVQVVMISEDGPPGGFPPKSGVCIPPPLGSGSCPGDSNPPLYRHLFETINSSDALIRLLNLYPVYKAGLRQNSVKYFAVITDDNSSMPAQDFIDGVNTLDPGWFDYWKFFGVYCTGTCSGGGIFGNPCASTGTVYTELAQHSGTTPGDLCAGQSNFSGVFSALAQSVVAGSKLDCQWAIPAPPAGEVFDAGRVNVKYTPGGGGPVEEIYYVPSASDCGPEGGWYYDDPNDPSTILVCPNTCDRMSNDLSAQVDILFGCRRIDVPK